MEWPNVMYLSMSIPSKGKKIMVKSIICKWFTSLLLFGIEGSNDQNPHPGDTHHSQILAKIYLYDTLIDSNA